jgi:hypothetical protein
MLSAESFRRFLRDERGGVLVEFLLMFPLMIWIWIALAVYWDVFRTMNSAQKAAYSISDLISRQEANLSEDFIDGMQDVYEFLMVNNGANSGIRITSFAYDEVNDRYDLIFSESPQDRLTPYTADDLEDLRTRIPLMGHRDSAVLVETELTYVYPFEIPFLSPQAGAIITGRVETEAGGVRVGQGFASTQDMPDFVITRPRFKSYICLEVPGCPVF